MSEVSKVVVSKSFERSIKQLWKKKQKKVLKELAETILKLEKKEITSNKDNHPLKDANKYNDLHICGKQYILIYKYDHDTLYLELKLNAFVTHDNLNKVNYKETDFNDFDSNEFYNKVNEDLDDEVDPFLILCKNINAKFGVEVNNRLVFTGSEINCLEYVIDNNLTKYNILEI